MSTYDMIKLEGRIVVLKTTIARMLQKYPNWSNEEIADLTGASNEFVQKVREN